MSLIDKLDKLDDEVDDFLSVPSVNASLSKNSFYFKFDDFEVKKNITVLQSALIVIGLLVSSVISLQLSRMIVPGIFYLNEVAVSIIFLVSFFFVASSKLCFDIDSDSSVKRFVIRNTGTFILVSHITLVVSSLLVLVAFFMIG